MSAYYNENDPKAAAWLRELIKAGHIAPGDVDERSIKEVQSEDVRSYTQCHFFAGIACWSYALRLAGWADSRPVWTGSCPCQSFSAAGKQEGFSDPRHLWPEWHRLIRECRPVSVFGEQVGAAIRHGWLDLVQDNLESINYTIGATVMGASSGGAPHIRERVYFVADNTESRRQSWGRVSKEGVGRNAPRIESGRLCTVGELADSTGDLGNTPINGNRTFDGQSESSGGREESARGSSVPGPTNAFWGDSEWIPCTDGKSRPVRPKFVVLASGPSSSVGSLCDSIGSTESKEKEINVRTSQARSDQSLSSLRDQDATEEIPDLSGGHGSVQEKEILRSTVHERGLHGSHKEFCTQEQPSPIGKDDQEGMRNLQSKQYSACCPSSGRESNEQLSEEFTDFVRLLSPAFALAKLHGDTSTEEALHTLFKTVRSERLLQHTSDSFQEIWASVTKEDQKHLRMEFNSGRWIKTGVWPLSRGAKARVARLRGYGNAIVAPLAQAFIEAYLEIEKEG